MTRPQRPARGAGRFVARVALEQDAPQGGYPFDLPVVHGLRGSGGIGLGAGVTFVVGENGSGKSTLVEALAVALGLNPEGGSRSFRFASRASESELGRYLRVTRLPGRERTSFFLRAESYYTVATEIERLDDEPGGPPLAPAFGGHRTSAHTASRSWRCCVIGSGSAGCICSTSPRRRSPRQARWRCWPASPNWSPVAPSS